MAKNWCMERLIEKITIILKKNGGQLAIKEPGDVENTILSRIQHHLHG
jgi:hypothetical protein